MFRLMTQDSWERLYQQVLVCMSPHTLGWVWSICCMATFFSLGDSDRVRGPCIRYTFLFFFLLTLQTHKGLLGKSIWCFSCCCLPGVFLPEIRRFDLGCGHHGIWGQNQATIDGEAKRRKKFQEALECSGQSRRSVRLWAFAKSVCRPFHSWADIWTSRLH